MTLKSVSIMESKVQNASTEYNTKKIKNTLSFKARNHLIHYPPFFVHSLKPENKSMSTPVQMSDLERIDFIVDVQLQFQLLREALSNLREKN